MVKGLFIQRDGFEKLTPANQSIKPKLDARGKLSGSKDGRSAIVYFTLLVPFVDTIVVLVKYQGPFHFMAIVGIWCQSLVYCARVWYTVIETGIWC